jgi:hypothetical protein
MMEACMRSRFSTAMFACAALGGAALCAPTASAEPYVYRQTSGSWTNVEYNDGACHYYFAHNAYDQETHLNRWGDCSRIAIGPNGEAMQIVPAPVMMAPYAHWRY